MYYFIHGGIMVHSCELMFVSSTIIYYAVYHHEDGPFKCHGGSVLFSASTSAQRNAPHGQLLWKGVLAESRQMSMVKWGGESSSPPIGGNQNSDVVIPHYHIDTHLILLATLSA